MQTSHSSISVFPLNQHDLYSLLLMVWRLQQVL